MYKYMFTMLLALNLHIHIHSMNTLIKLPSEQDLRNKLYELDLEHFLQKTELDKKLADKEFYLRGVVTKLELVIIDYKNYFEQQPMGALMYKIFQARKSEILRAILFNNPDAITTLENEHIIN